MAMKKPHAIMVCLHLQGHINPFVNLAIKSKGISITFAHLESTHHHISKSQHAAAETDIFAGSRSSGLDIRYTTFSDGFPLDLDRAYDIDYLKFYRDGFIDSVDKLVVRILHSDSSVPASNYFLISDTMSVWSKKIAEKYDLVNVSFWTGSASFFSLCYPWDLPIEKRHVPVDGRCELVDNVPRINSINTEDFVQLLQDKAFRVLYELVFECFANVKSADFILCNSVQQLEAESVSDLQQRQPFYSIGPLFPVDFSNSVAKSLLPPTDTAHWLNSRPIGSVLYISFGSLNKIDRNVIDGIAGGLLLSEVNFVWVVRQGMVDSGGGRFLPEAFEDLTRNRGLVVPWCNQNEVLQNPAIGGFLTHCGWNSILESVWCGVPMICYPLGSDQITNRKLVVDDWRVGINLRGGESIRKEEVAEKMEVLMSEKSSIELREKIQKLKMTFRNAISVGGSSENNIDRFIEEILTRCH